MNVRNRLSENYRKKLFEYYVSLEQAAGEQGEPAAGFTVDRLLASCLDLPSPERERLFVNGVLSLSGHEEVQWLPKAA